MAVMKVVIINNTYRKAIWSFLSNYPVPSRIALSADRHHSWCEISLIKQLKQKICLKKNILPFHHPTLGFRLCHLCQEYPVESIRYDSHCSDRWYKYRILNSVCLHLQALLWALVHQKLLWNQFYPVKRHTDTWYLHLMYTLKSQINFFFTYYFSFGSFESLWSFFSAITLETSD